MNEIMDDDAGARGLSPAISPARLDARLGVLGGGGVFPSNDGLVRFPEDDRSPKLRVIAR